MIETTTEPQEVPTTPGGEQVGEHPLVSPLILSDLRIQLQGYGDHKGRYLATVKYKGDAGEIALNLSPELSSDLMRFCGGSIKRFSDSAALELKAAIDESARVADDSASLG